MNPEKERLEAQRQGTRNWRLWGPYLSDRAWGTVREDYSADGEAWEYFTFDQARSRTYRWSEDGMGGICDEQQRLCLAFAFWNGRDPILKERAFGLTGKQGNHAEDVKDVFFHLHATPSHAYLEYLYKYPQAEFPYSQLVEENARRTRRDPTYTLLDTGVFRKNRYWDIFISYAKEDPETVFARITVVNRGPEAASLHVLPTLWFRNRWSWGNQNAEKPKLISEHSKAVPWIVKAEDPDLGTYRLYGKHPAESLYTENESNLEQLYGSPNGSPFVKDAFHRRVIHGDRDAVNPRQQGTRFAAWHVIECGPGETETVDLLLSSKKIKNPFETCDNTFAARRAEADAFYGALSPEATEEDARIFRQAAAGMIWSKQFFHYNAAQWLDGDRIPPPEERRSGRNRQWRHLRAADVISMPDSWEYPWFAAWDMAYHCMVFSLFDVDFAKNQLELLLGARYLHPNGQIPAYEWAFGDVNPPVHAAAALEVFRAEADQRGEGDLHFLRRVFNKLVMNYTWWLNRKDSEGQNVFEGGFMGLDNISVYDRSTPLPTGYSLKQADATGWMAMFALNMTAMALELAREHSEYEDMAIQCYEQFLAIAYAIAGYTSGNLSLWDPMSGFFKDLVIPPDGTYQRIDVYSYVGIIPLFACEIVGPRLLENAPRFRALLDEHKGGLFDGHIICECPHHTNDNGERLLSLVDHTMLPMILNRLLNENEFLSKHGIRSVSRIHERKTESDTFPGVGAALIEYEPGESTSGLFGGNSNWRGPVWMPINYSLLLTLRKFHRYLGPNFKVFAPSLDSEELNLEQVADRLSRRLVDLYRRDDEGRIPAYPVQSPFQTDPFWKDLHLFYEYFHGDNGLGLGASHQTGWTGLLANLILP